MQFPRTPPLPDGGEGHRIAAEAKIEPVDRPHQRDAALIVLFAAKSTTACR
jgi:hypothetical protein